MTIVTDPQPIAPLPEPTLVGKRIAAVIERPQWARDTFGDWHDFTLTTLYFTDGTSHAFALDNTDTYAPVREQLECSTCTEPLVESADVEGTYVHPHDAADCDAEEPTPKEREPYAGPDPEPRKDLPRTPEGFVDTSAEYGYGFAVEVQYQTDYDGRRLDDGEEARTLHGPFTSEAEANAWVEDWPDGDTDVEDFAVVPLNGVRPKPNPWPAGDDERAAFVGWQWAVDNGDTPSSFREWFDHEKDEPEDTEAGLDPEAAA